jgi:hypothetical protein
MSIRRLSLLLLLASLPAAFAHAASESRKTLVVEGRTIDAEGFPIERVKVRVIGGHRASTTSNADGQFTLKLPLGTVRDLQRTPLRIALEAERRGYRFAVPGGDPRLGLEVGLDAGGDSPRCVARSNDERVAASAARIVALDGEAVGLVVVNFLGEKGEPRPSGAWPALTQVAQSALPFGLQGPVAAIRQEPDVIDTVGAPTTRPRGSWSIVDPGAARKSRRADRGRSVPRTTAERLGETRPQQQPPTEIDTARAGASARPSVMPTGKKTGEAPREVPPGRGEVEPAPSSTVSPPASPVPGAKSSPPPSTPVIIPSPPFPSGRARSRPLVITNPPRGETRADSCQCRIEGTVEVQTVVPIRGPQRIEVSLQWYPQLRDTVELFMGPPRPFKLPIAPCGPQRLRLRVLTDQHFDVASREAMAGFRCEGRLVQPRIVLSTR